MTPIVAAAAWILVIVNGASPPVVLPDKYPTHKQCDAAGVAWEAGFYRCIPAPVPIVEGRVLRSEISGTVEGLQ